MPRQKNTRLTNIYWLYDTRPETIAMFGPLGQPFYCGKTVYTIEFRLQRHRQAAVANPHRLIAIHLATLGQHVRTELKEIVPLEISWVAREQHWISTLRTLNTNCFNISNGGDGPAGLIHSDESRAKMAASQRGKKRSPEAIAKVAAANRGKKRSPETRAKMRQSPARRAKMSAVHRGKITSDETKAKMSAAMRGRKLSPEHIEKSHAKLRGRKLSPEHIANLTTASHRHRAARIAASYARFPL